MDFARSGMLGVVVLSIALAGALFGAYLAGVETEEKEVTAYEYLADVSGMFSYDRTPQYIDFDSSTNYTGYYSTESGKYFPVSKVSYEKYQAGVNNYRVALEPTTVSTDLSVSDTGSGSWVVWYDCHYEDNAIAIELTGTEDMEYHTIYAAHEYLADFLEDNGITYEYNQQVEIRSADPAGQPDPADARDDWGFQADWIMFTSKSEWEIQRTEAMWYTCASSEYAAAYPTANVKVPCLSCSVDFQTGTVTRYYDNDCTQVCDQIMLDSCIVVYGGNASSLAGNYGMKLAGDMTVDVITPQTPQYLDPSRGVELKAGARWTGG